MKALAAAYLVLELAGCRDSAGLEAGASVDTYWQGDILHCVVPMLSGSAGTVSFTANDRALVATFARSLTALELAQTRVDFDPPWVGVGYVLKLKVGSHDAAYTCSP